MPAGYYHEKGRNDRKSSAYGAGFGSRASAWICRRQSQSGRIPNTPNEQSIKRQPNGISRMPPMTKAKGITSTQAIIPNSMTQMFFTGSRNGPMNAMAITKCANASQSVP
jgi:hypothetical protein